MYSFILQGCGLDNRIMVMIGLFSVISGGILLTDWQAIPSDPCTEYSPFHHPELIKYSYAASMSLSISDERRKRQMGNDAHEIAYNNIQANVCFPNSYVDGLKFDASTMKVKCNGKEVDSCAKCVDENVTAAAFSVPPSVPCFSLGYRAGKLHVIEDSYIPLQGPTSLYLCSARNHSEYCACVIVRRDDSMMSSVSPSDNQSTELQESLQSAAHIQSIQLVEDRIYSAAMNKCESLHDAHGCHWIPHSRITGELCSNCPLICRSVHHTLTFVQFCIGAMLMKVSLPTGRISAVNLITDVVDVDIHLGNYKEPVQL